MASTAWNASTASGATLAGTQSCTFVSTSDSTLDHLQNQDTTENNHKRIRLTQDTPSQSLTNGFVNVSNDKSTMGWPFRPDIMQKFRCTFDERFKGALQQTLSSYFTRLQNTETAVETLRTECKELGERIIFIENTAKDFKSALSERVVLPTPTTGVGQRRTLSSQAPRMPPIIPATVSEQTHVSNPSSQLATCQPSSSAVQSTPVNLPARPSLPTLLRDPLLITTSPPALIKSTTKSAPSQSIQKPVVSQPQPQPQTKSPLNARSMDTIDLTSESSPNSSAPDDNTLMLRTVNGALARPQIQPTVPCATPALSKSTASTHHTSSSTTSTANNQKIAWLAAHTVPVSSAKSTWLPTFQPKLLSYKELQQLPVAPLPPTPLQPSHHPPVQPMPQLTIAEAAEGVCLQWTVAFQSVVFEAAIAYEIYSYASSELTSETIYTCLPWKKVGEVAALPLPMACTLTHVQSNNMYYFIVRSFDRFRRYSAWSNVVNAYVG